MATVTDPTYALRQIIASGGIILHVCDSVPRWVWLNSNEALVHPDRIEELRQKLDEEPGE